MQQKKAVRVLEDDSDSRTSRLYICDDYMTCSERPITTTSDKETSRYILKLYWWMITVLRLSLIITFRAVSWLNRLGDNEVDVKLMERSRKHCFDMRIHRMGN